MLTSQLCRAHTEPLAEGREVSGFTLGTALQGFRKHIFARAAGQAGLTHGVRWAAVELGTRPLARTAEAALRHAIRLGAPIFAATFGVEGERAARRWAGRLLHQDFAC